MFWQIAPDRWSFKLKDATPSLVGEQLTDFIVTMRSYLKVGGQSTHGNGL
jgi:hypothetical protein